MINFNNWPTLLTEWKEKRPNSLTILFCKDRITDVFMTNANPKQIAIRNQKTLKLKVRLICPALFREKYNNLMKEGSLLKEKRKKEVDKYWQKIRSGEDENTLKRPFGISYRVAYDKTNKDMILQVTCRLNLDGTMKWKTEPTSTSTFPVQK